MQEALPKITIYTDGACSGNPGKGGWGAVLLFKDNEKIISGFNLQTTNNIMELTAVVESLKVLKTKCVVEFFTDSKYVIDGITKWCFGWQKNNWKTADKKDVKNKELWQSLIEESSKHEIKWNWVKGHSGDYYNEKVDEIARLQIK